MDIHCTKFYVRFRENNPESELNYSLYSGLKQLGVEVVPYYWNDEIDQIDDLSPEIGVGGYIQDVWQGLKRLNIEIKPDISYPEPLKYLLQRDVYETNLGQIRSRIKPIFIKPVEHKLFTGFVYDNSQFARRLVVTLPDETLVLACDVVNFVSEYRTMILDNQILDCRRYKGDWSKAPDRKIVEDAVEIMRGKSPKAYCLDFGVTDDGRTLLVEMNDGFAFGNYGMNCILYAKMIAARWWELAGGVDIST